MIKNAGMVRKIGLSVAIGGLALGASVASAETFNATALIENTLTITTVQDMDFGTLFAGGADDQTISGLVLAADGGVTTATPIDIAAVPTGTAPQLISLGGAQAARGSVSVAQNVEITVPDLPSTALVSGNVFVPGAGIAMTVNSDPTEAAFYLADFVVGDAVGGTVGAGTAGVFPITKDFGATEIEFGIGTSIYTDGAGAPRTSYQAATYSGTFDVTASY